VDCREKVRELLGAERPSWGGPRRDAGRAPAEGSGVRHRTRPQHRGDRPVHVTLRLAEGLPDLRGELLHAELRDAVHETLRDDFRIAACSVHSDHVRMLVEADDGAALAAGMKAFAVRAARRLNARLGRSGTVWLERYHGRDVVSPRDARNALAYVMDPTHDLAAPRTWLLTHARLSPGSPQPPPDRLSASR
jgi:REP element-mobilizing transposase RayT